MRRAFPPTHHQPLGSLFTSDAKGSVTLLFAFCSVILLAMLGLAVDYGRATKAKARLTAAADAATLAAVRAATDIANAHPDLSSSQIAAQAEELARNFMASNTLQKIDATVSPVEVHVELSNGAWSSTLGFAASVDTTVSAALGIQTINVGGTSKSSIRPTFPVLDIAMCVDSTGSMTPTLDAVKANASNFFDNLNAELNTRNLPSFPLVRVRMIYFKDFGDRTPGYWDPDPIRASQFMQLPSQTSDFSAFVSPQMAGGGWDTPESGIECLNEAMNSQWMKVGQVPDGFTMPVTDVYPLIVIWTDAPSHPVPFPNSLANPAYPPESTMPRTFNALLAKWNNGSVIDQTHKQILFFGNPDITSYDQGAFESGWRTVKSWPGFTVGGSLTEANTSMIEFLASGIANKAKQLRITQ
jgi:Flp pilus assembly protein TadG